MASQPGGLGPLPLATSCQWQTQVRYKRSASWLKRDQLCDAIHTLELSLGLDWSWSPPEMTFWLRFLLSPSFSCFPSLSSESLPQQSLAQESPSQRKVGFPRNKDGHLVSQLLPLSASIHLAFLDFLSWDSESPILHPPVFDWVLFLAANQVQVVWTGESYSTILSLTPSGKWCPLFS